MSSKKQIVKDTLIAIKSVRRRMEVAVSLGQDALAYQLMGDILALFQCLEIDSADLASELERIEAVAYRSYLKLVA